MSRWLVCNPSEFGVHYSINPWMDPANRVHAPEAETQWTWFMNHVREYGGDLTFITPHADLPDMVFTANHGFVLDGTVLLPRFKHEERRGEEYHVFKRFELMKAHGQVDRIVDLPRGRVLEGQGDVLWDPHRKIIWHGYGQRSDRCSDLLEDTFGAPVVSLKLVDPRFYHLDTCFCPLTGGHLMWYPEAFDDESREAVKMLTRPFGTYDVSLHESEALDFSCNAVNVGPTVIMSKCSPQLRRDLGTLGYKVFETPLTEFHKSGGSAACLTLRLDNRSTTFA